MRRKNAGIRLPPQLMSSSFNPDGLVSTSYPKNLMKKLIALSALTLVSTVFAADVAYSPPVGGMSVQINGGTLAVPVTTSFSVPLLDVPAAVGASVGRISSLTANSITITGAGWTAGALAMPAFPYAVRITSGAAEGVTLSVTANTADTLTVSGRDLTQLGIAVGAAGDSIQLLPVDTLNSLFGSNTFLGGPNPASADIITISTNSQLSYYYNTTSSRWVRTTGPTTDRGNTPIPIDSVVSVTRKGAALSLVFLGNVPMTKVNMLIANAGSTYTHTGFPQDVTLGDLNLQTQLAGWVSASTASQADVLSISSGGSWISYFHNGSYWQRTTGPTTNRNAIVIAAGTPIQLFKRGVAAGNSVFIRNRPF